MTTAKLADTGLSLIYLGKASCAWHWSVFGTI